MKDERAGKVDTTAFVILHYGDFTVTDTCVQSILRMDRQDQIRIVIVDNELQRPEQDRQKNFQSYQNEKNITVLYMRENGGFSYANNQGYRYARETLHASFIVVLNNDIEFVQADFLKRLENIWKTAQCHVIAPDIIRRGTGEHQNPMDIRLRTREEAEGTIKKNRIALRYYPLLYPFLYWNYIWSEKKKTRERKKSEAEFQMAQENIVPFGACIIFTPLFTAAEDQAFFPETKFFYEEYLLSCRCGKQNYRIIYSPELKAFHESGAATRRSYKNEKKRLRFVMERTMESCGIYLRYLKE